MATSTSVRELSAGDLLHMVETACQTSDDLDLLELVQESRLQPLIDMVDELREMAEISDPDAALALHRCADTIRAIQWNRAITAKQAQRDQQTAQRRQQDILIARKTAFLRRHRGEYVHA